MFRTLMQDREWIENKYHFTDQPFNPYKRMAYHGHACDPTTGMSDEEIRLGLRELAARTEALPHPIAKAQAIAYVLEHTRIGIDEHDYFFSLWSWNRLPAETTLSKWKQKIFETKLPETDALMKDLNASGAVSIWPDFDHVVPDWDSLVSLGFSGVRERARQYRRMHEAKGKLSERQAAFFDGIELEYTAILAFIDRLARHAAAQTHEKAPKIARCLSHLHQGPPTDIYEAMMLIFLYFMISESVDYYQVRSLGNGLDHTLYPFYVHDLQNGTYTHDEIRELLGYFLLQWSAIGNYWGQPFYLGGSNADGTCRINALSHDIIDVFRELGLYNPKIQIKYNTNTPPDFLGKVLDMIRAGNSSFVFCCEPGMMAAVMSYGATWDEALTMDIRGCYETGVRANEVSASNGYINPLKAVVLALHDGYDSITGKQIGISTGKAEHFTCFEDFYQAFRTQYAHLIEQVIACTNAYEQYFEEINPSSMYSATIVTSLEHAFDGYAGGVKYNNSATLNCGLATAVDALMAVRELVYEKQLVTLAELRDILDRNWEGAERLRAMALRSKHKYGNGDPITDAYAAAVSRFFTDRVNGRKNARGGVYKAVLHSAMQFVWQGQKTEATPDGRRLGDEISKNASPTVGMDRNGVTALIRSVTAIPPASYPESFCLDVLLHPSATEGDEGLTAMRALLDTYLNRGGMAMQFNVLRPEMLRDAQEHPERYRNLQVRVCGWNVLWNNLSRKEQDAYILRAEHVSC